MKQSSTTKSIYRSVIVGVVGVLCVPWVFLNLESGGLAVVGEIAHIAFPDMNDQFGKFEVVGVPAGDTVEISRTKMQERIYKRPRQFFDRPGVFDYSTAKDGYITFGPAYNSFQGRIPLDKVSFRIEDLKRYLKAGDDEHQVRHYGGESHSPFRLVDFDGDGTSEVVFQYFYDTIMGPTCLNISAYQVKDNVPVRLYRRYWAKSPYSFVRSEKRNIMYNVDSAGRGTGYTIVDGQFKSVWLPIGLLLFGWMEYISLASVVVSLFPALFWWAHQRHNRGREVDDLSGMRGFERVHIRKCFILWVLLCTVIGRLSTLFSPTFFIWNLNVFPIALMAWRLSARMIRRRYKIEEIAEPPSRMAAAVPVPTVGRPGRVFREGKGRGTLVAGIVGGIWIVANLIFICTSCFGIPLPGFDSSFDSSMDALVSRMLSQRAFEVVGVPIDRPIRKFRYPDYSATFAGRDTDVTRWNFEVDTPHGASLAADPEKYGDHHIWDRPAMFDYNTIRDSWISFAGVSSETVPLQSVSFEPAGLQNWLDRGFVYHNGYGVDGLQDYFTGDFDGDGDKREVFLSYAHSGVFWKTCWIETLYRVDKNRPTKIHSEICRKYPHVIDRRGGKTLFVTTEDGRMGVSKRLGVAGLENAATPFDVRIGYIVRYLEPYWILISFFPVLVAVGWFPCRWKGFTPSEKGRIAVSLCTGLLASAVVVLLSSFNDNIFGLMNLNLGFIWLLVCITILKVFRVDFTVASADVPSDISEPARQTLGTVPRPSSGGGTPEYVRTEWRVMGPYILCVSLCMAWPFITWDIFEGEMNLFCIGGIMVLSGALFNNIYLRILSPRVTISFTDDGIIYSGPEQKIHVHWSSIVCLRKKALTRPGVWGVICEEKKFNFEILKTHPQASMIEMYLIQKGIPIDEKWHVE